jgi:hypothetical protein
MYTQTQTQTTTSIGTGTKVAVGVALGAAAIMAAAAGYLARGTSSSAAPAVTRAISAKRVSATLYGDTASDYTGQSVAMGDFNGDGMDDLLVGASGEDNGGGASSGSVYLLYGDSAGFSRMSEISAAADATFYSTTLNDTVGEVVASAGDIDGDGYDDFLIAAAGDDENGSNAGAAFVFYGSSTAYSGSISVSAADAKLLGDSTATYFPDALGSLGDIDADGYDDLGFGDYNDDIAGIIYGGSTRLSGSTELSTTVLTSLVLFSPESSSDGLGSAITTAGDINADGYDDFLVGAMTESTIDMYAGAVYLWYGSATRLAGVAGAPLSVTSADAKFTGEAIMDTAGRTLSTAGDIDADGYDDFLVGAALESTTATYSGAVYVLLGDSAVYSGDISLADANLKILGQEEEDRFGWSLTALGDQNADGYMEFAVGAYSRDYDSTTTDETGAAYIFDGRATTRAIAAATDASASLARLTIYGITEEAGLGYALAAGDVEGDGDHDLIMGAWKEEVFGAEGGAVFIQLTR